MRFRNVAALVAASSIALGAREASAQTAVIVHRSSAVSNVPVDELRRFFLGKTTITSSGQQITLVELSPLRGKFYKALLGLTADEVRRRWVALVFKGDATALPFELPDAPSVRKYVAEHPGAVAFIPADEVDDTVKIVRVDGKLPTDPAYPIK
jgi:hypothetical protein